MSFDDNNGLYSTYFPLRITTKIVKNNQSFILPRSIPLVSLDIRKINKAFQ